MSKPALDSQDIVGLLSKLKDRTPDYPTDLMAARKATFLQTAIALQLTGSGMGGKGGGDSGIGGNGGTGGSGVLGGTSTAQTILLQAVIGVWIIAAMLTAAYVFRDQIIDFLQDNGIVNVEMTQAPSGEFPIPATLAPATVAVPTAITTPAGTAIPGVESDIEAMPEIENAPDSKDNPGLHLGQTPGAPDTPNQDKPDKPEKPDNPGRPDRPGGNPNN